MCSSESLTDLEMAVAAMFRVFMSHQGENGKLTKTEFLNVLGKELPAFSKDECGEEIFNCVDLDEDGFVDFKEFSLLVASYAWGSFDILQEAVKAMAQKGSL